MPHIKQRGPGIYTFIADSDGEVVTENLESHPAMVEHPEKFRIADGLPPELSQGLVYSSSISPAEEI